ncbi:uncharacterized protein LOC128984564 [Macrosteles quadrilineatus]|uniref:uncharacterized protein LOC128984564 n=1 Tax=Macrosteles quadrilineatus TaxID=74068 RepID=UPI0023E284A6|nr:uncharacterized protein LOC128984564 [Macrosteles quadrilineatus]
MICKLLMVLITSRTALGRVPCIDNCDKPKMVVCGFDRRQGAKLFDNLCAMDAWNLCYHTDFEAQPTIEDCMKMFEEEYSRESMVPFKNPLIIQMYKHNKVDNLYL